ncbi:Hemin import ATP-binding protein HmuV [Pseudidiomarina piscicola]|uniref:Hemin import ATP-binding protein HmuV n=1 Tax=Pseudidiomarina piscicola TaxID=2614830 RepID=A0A6S6WMF2_9GAMM|nr:ABC transporter ATP-binding protein [Pseudidiomarina piscicola]CAB0152012.1 Hemin import ATP-binding protein HmuV [Pseudidiomarina piscicola]VZT41452.1 Hemin import ATP-binding protein HmuV [Pseudomonas aeruginosa]
MTTLDVRQLSHSTRLREVSFSANNGQLVGVIGANGAGKSTLLQLLCGVVPADSGTVWYQGDNLLQTPMLERRQLHGYLPQNPLVETDVSVTHFLQAGLVNLKIKQPASELARVVDSMQLEPLMGRPVTQLSGGEQRRVHLARALLGNQPWLICDEPTASLDLYYQLQVMEVLKAQATQGKLVTIALHDLGLAARFCDRLLLLNQAELLAQGTPAEVLSDENLAQAYGIKARWLCTDEGVSLLPSLLTSTSN